SIALSSPGVIVALGGSVFHIAGASGTVEIPEGFAQNGPHVITQQVWSNGGSLTLSTSNTAGPGLDQSPYFSGMIDAAGGAAEAAGGTLNVSTTGGGIVVGQGGDVAAPFAANAMPTTRTELLGELPTTTATSFIDADTISSADSGLDTASFTGPL